MQEDWLRGEKWWSTEGGRLPLPAFKNWVCPFSPSPLLFKLSKGTSVSVVFSELYLTKSLLPDEGPSEANPSKRDFWPGKRKGPQCKVWGFDFLETTICIGLLCPIILSLFLSRIYYKMRKTSPIFFAQWKTSF